MKKRMLSLLLALVFVAGLLPVQGAAAVETLEEAVISTDGLTPQIANAYLEKVDELVEKYGGYSSIETDEYGRSHITTGFAGGYAMDMVGDALPDLFLFSFSDEDTESPQAGVADKATCQLWTWDSDHAKLYAETVFNTNTFEYRDLSLMQISGAFYLDMTGGDWSFRPHNDESIFAIEPDGFQHILSASETFDNDEYPGIEGETRYNEKGESYIYQACIRENGGSENFYTYDEFTKKMLPWRSDKHYPLFKYDETFTPKVHPNGEELRAQLEAIANTGLTAADLLARLPYVGDISKCKMTPAMANAFADVLKNKQPLYTALFDTGNGIPALWMVGSSDPSEYLDVETYFYDNGGIGVNLFYDNRYIQILEWDGTKLVETANPKNAKSGNIITYHGAPYYLATSPGSGVVADYGEARYPMHNGRIAGTAESYYIHFVDSNYGRDTEELKEIMKDNYAIPLGIPIDFSEIHPSDWYIDEYGNPALYLIDGKPGDEGAVDAWYANIDWNSATLSLSSFDTGVTLYGSWLSGSSVEKTLRAFADSGPSYTFPAVTDDEALVKAIAEAVAAKLGGKITGIYQLADGLWYVVITVDGTTKGAVVQAVKSGGKLTYEVLDSHDTPAEEEVLQGLANDFQSKPNLSPDYAATEGFTSAKEYEDYLKKLLENIPGGTPNDAAKGELAAFLENSVSRVSTVTVSAKGNRVTLTGSDISAGCASAKEAGDKLQGVLTDADVSLNKALTIIIRVECQGLDSGKPLQLDLDKSLLDTLGDAELMLLLGDSSHAVRLTSADLQALINAYGVLSIQMERTGTAYTINFLDAKGEIITRLCANVSFLLPASGPLATVLASYQGGSDNWGGQYDARTAAILFSTPYSGVYEVMENDLTISDLDGLSEEQRTAVAFMVSKGYFTLDGADAFHPAVSLTRYDFTKALVGMFFALEHSLPTTFTDVPADSPYRDVVASAQAKDIVKGYNETTFAGEENISGEQVLTLAGRTLVERKGYSYPADPAQYLTFPGGAEVDNWAKEATALAVREGVLAPGESLAPLADLSRADAALYLYRLFMLLYETSPEAIQMQTPPEEPASAVPVVPIVLAVVGVAFVGGGGAWLWLMRKRGVEAK